MSELKNKIPSLEEIRSQLKNSKVETLTLENKNELKNIFIYSSFVLLFIIYVYYNPFNFTSFLGIIKFIQLLLIIGIIYGIYKLNMYMKIFKHQSEKIEHIYEEKTIKK